MIKGINLIPDDIQRQWRIQGIRKSLSAVAVVYLVILSLVFINQRLAISEKKAEAAGILTQRDALISKSSQYSELSTKLRGIQQAEAELKRRLSLTSDLSDKRISWSAILKKLSNDIPSGVWLKSLSTSDIQGSGGKKIRVLGNSSSNRAIADFIFTLENSGYFQDVSLSYSQKKEIANKSLVYDFEVYMTVKRTDEIMYEW